MDTTYTRSTVAVDREEQVKFRKRKGFVVRSTVRSGHLDRLPLKHGPTKQSRTAPLYRKG